MYDCMIIICITCITVIRWRVQIRDRPTNQQSVMSSALLHRPSMS